MLYSWEDHDPYVVGLLGPRILSAGSAFGPGFFGVAAEAGLSWVNQGSVVKTTNPDGSITMSQAAAGDNVRARVQPAPAAPYTITIAVAHSGLGTAGPQQGGIVLRDSASGKLVMFDVRLNAVATPLLEATKYNSPTVYSGANYFISNMPGFALVYWLRAQDDGTNRILSVSLDGWNFVQYASVLRTDFITPDQIGWFVNCVGGHVYTTLLSYRVTQP